MLVESIIINPRDFKLLRGDRNNSIGYGVYI